MDLNRAAIFVSVVDDGGFSAAARALSLPKSSVSRAVAMLEEELGVRLLQRSTRKVSLTEAGSAFYARASRGVAGLQEAAAAVTDMHGAVRGRVRVTAPVDAGVWLLAPAVAEFVVQHPGISVDVVLTARVVDLVDEGFDLAVRAGPLRDGALIARRIGELEAALYASPEYVARRGMPARAADLAGHDCVMFRATRGGVTWNLTGPEGDLQVDVTGPVTADDFSFVRRAVLAGAGIGLVPSFLCRAPVRRGKMVRVLPSLVLRGAPLSVVYPSARYLPQRVALFRDFIIAAIGRGALDADDDDDHAPA